MTPILSDRARPSYIRQTIRSTLTRMGPADTLVVYVAAHGSNEGGVPAIITALASPDYTGINSIPLDDFAGWVYGGVRPAKEVRMFLDFCYSGSFAYLLPRPEARPGGKGKPKPVPDYVILSAAMSEKDALKGKALEDVSFGGGHGAFTYFVLRGLNAPEAAGTARQVNARALFEYVHTQVRQTTKDRQMPDRQISKDVVLADLAMPGLPFGTAKVGSGVGTGRERDTASPCHRLRLVPMRSGSSGWKTKQKTCCCSMCVATKYRRIPSIFAGVLWRSKKHCN